ncbi:hypothetical protein BCL80_1373 [Streptomyces avidinii]|nr:hypothetical protein BCL80_1373 [Streptomyces avidinii]SNX81280.1 hypothetical protein SAMN05421860_1331 [Streptomyces microflavus]
MTALEEVRHVQDAMPRHTRIRSFAVRGSNIVPRPYTHGQGKP